MSDIEKVPLYMRGSRYNMVFGVKKYSNIIDATIKF